MVQTITVRILATFGFLLLIFGFTAPGSGQIFNSTWAGGTGDWTDASNWSTLDFPRNNGSEYYNAIISGGGNTVNLAGVYEIDSLSVGFGSILNLNNNTILTIVSDPSRSTSGSVVNSGSIFLNATNLGSTLRFDGTVTLTGGGTIFMGNDAGNQLTGTNNGMLINEDNVIRGSGTIGTFNTLGFLNRGQVIADQSVPLNIALDPGVTNEGQMQATSGGTLNLVGGTLSNELGVIEAKTGSTISLTNMTVDGGQINTLGTGQISIQNSIFDSSTNQVTVDGTVNIDNNRTLTVLGDLINKQNINLNATTLASSLRFDGTVELSGGGSVNLGDDGGNQLIGVNNGTLINKDHLIQGSGTIGTSNTLALNNQATIESNATVGMTIIGNAGVTNTGIMRSTNGSLLTLIGGTFANANGLIEAQTGSTVLINNATIDGGDINTSGTGTISVLNSTFDSSTNQVTLDSVVNVDNNRSLTVIGDLVNMQSINLNATSLSSNLRINGEVELTGGGTINMNVDSGNQVIGMNGGKLINQDHLIRGTGTIGTSNTLELINNNSIVSDENGMTILGTPGVTNNSLLRATNSATLNLVGGVFDNQLGVIEADNDSLVNLQSMTVLGGTLRSIGTGSFSAAATIFDGTLTPVVIDGQVNVANNQTLTLKGTIENKTQTIDLLATNLNSNISVFGSVQLEGGGTIHMNNDLGNRIIGASGGFLTNVDNRIHGSGFIGLASSLQVLNQGVIEADQSEPLTLIGSGGFTNENQIRAINGASLNLNSGAFENALGVISASDSSFLNLVSTTVRGGTVQADGSSLIVSSQSTLDGSSDKLMLDGEVFVGNNLFLNLKGDIANMQDITLNATNLSSQLRIEGTVNLDGNGRIVMNDDAGNQIRGIVDGFLINQDNRIEGAGNLGINTLQMTNRGVIDANATNTLFIDPDAGGFLNDTGGLTKVSGAGCMTLLAGNHTNRGTFEVDTTRVLSINSGANFENESGLVDIESGALINVTGTYTQSGGVTHNNGTLASSILNDFNGGSLTGNGFVDGDADFDVASTIAAGDSVGMIDFLDDLNMAGTFEIELQGLLVEGAAQDINLVNTGTTRGLTEFDQINVYGDVTLADGTILDVSRLGGFNPQVGDFFDVLTGDSISLLGSLNIQTDSVGLIFSSSVHTLFDPTTGSNRDVLRLTTISAVPEPNASAILAFVFLIGFSLLLRRERAVYAAS